MRDFSASSPPPGGTYPLGPHAVARVGFGVMQLAHHPDDRSHALAVLRRAVELGVDHFDTAQFYGDGFANELLREVVGRDAIIVSKVGAVPAAGPIPLRPAQRPEELRASVEANLASLGVERIAVVNLRRLDVGPGIRAEGDQIVDLEDQLATMIELRDEGKIGGIGLSAVDVDGLRRALPAGIVCVQNAYSLVARQFEDLLELCVAEGIAWAPFFPLGGAFPGMPKVTEHPVVVQVASRTGRSPSQVGLAWLLGHAANTLLIPGTSSLEHLEQNVAAGSVELDEETIAELDAIAAPGAPMPDPFAARGEARPTT